MSITVSTELDPQTGRPIRRQRPIILPPYVSKFNFEIALSAKMSALSRVLVYYVREDGETVADSQQIHLNKCLRNKVGAYSINSLQSSFIFLPVHSFVFLITRLRLW